MVLSNLLFCDARKAREPTLIVCETKPALRDCTVPVPDSVASRDEFGIYSEKACRPDHIEIVTTKNKSPKILVLLYLGLEDALSITVIREVRHH